MSPKSDTTQSKLDESKRRRIAVTQVKTRIQALKFAHAYRDAWDATVAAHGSEAVRNALAQVRMKGEWVPDPTPVEQAIRQLTRFPLEGLTPIDPRNLDDFDPATERLTVLSNAVRIGTDGGELAGWIVVHVNPRCTEEEWRAAYQQFATDRSERIERQKEWGDDFGPRNAFALLAMDRSGAKTAEICAELRRLTRSAVDDHALRTYWYRMKVDAEDEIRRVEDRIVRGEHAALLASVDSPWERYLASGVMPASPTLPERRPEGEISTLYRVDSPYRDPGFSL